MIHLIACPECDKSLQVPDGLVGKKVQCPQCTNTFIATLPAADEAPEQRAATPAPPDMERKRTARGAARATNRRDDDDDDDDDHDDRDRLDDDDDDRPSRRSISRRDNRGKVPGKVTAISILTMIGGVFATFLGIMWLVTMGLGTCGLGCLWPGFYYSLVAGIMAIVKASTLMGANARNVTPPVGIGVMLIINIINGDVIGVTIGILILVFSSDEEVVNYLAH